MQKVLGLLFAIFSPVEIISLLFWLLLGLPPTCQWSICEKVYNGRWIKLDHPPCDKLFSLVIPLATVSKLIINFLAISLYNNKVYLLIEASSSLRNMSSWWSLLNICRWLQWWVVWIYLSWWWQCLQVVSITKWPILLKQW